MEGLRNICLKFLPLNTTALTQPMDMGIIRNLKLFHCQKLVSLTIEGVENEVFREATTATDVSSKVNVLQAIQFISDSWRSVTSRTIQNCFRHCGFVKGGDSQRLSTLEQDDEDDGLVTTLARAQNISEFVDIEGPCMADETLSGDYIVAEMIDERDGGTGDDDDDEEEQCQPEPVTLKTAIECLEKLRHFSIQEGNEDSPRQPLNLWADYLNNLTLRRSKQVTLDQFLAK